MATSGHYYGWLPDEADARDLPYAVAEEILQALPKRIDLRRRCPPIYDQGTLGSCTANAIAGAIAYEQLRLHAPEQFTPSRLFIYYNERSLTHEVESDSGAPLRDGMKAVNHLGVCPEDQPASADNWPYDPTLFANRPPEGCYTAARHVRALRYQRLERTPEMLKGCLAEGYPFVFGIVVHASFESEHVKKTGQIPLPVRGDKNIGGHAMMAVGYDDHNQMLIVRNSWGAAWGHNGYGFLPYAYLFGKGLARDLWTIRLLSDTGQQKPAAAARASSRPKQAPPAKSAPARR